VLFVVEDAHWIDPTTAELIELVLDRLANCAALVLITARPNFELPLAAHPAVNKILLDRIEREAGEEIIDRIAERQALPREIVGEILDKADGVPLFIEELSRAVLESGRLKEADADHTSAGPVSALAVPSSLHDSLVARLDRLQPIKRVAQAAACIGREFTYELLAAILPEPEAKLRDALDELAGAELIFRRGTASAASYTFKHALVRDAAYQLLLKGQREQFHRRIAEVLRERFTDTVTSQPELLALHYTEAGMVEPAIEFWRRAGALAVSRSAHREAIGHFERALALLAKLPPNQLRDESELDLMLALAVPLIAVHGFGSTRVEQCAGQAKALSDKLPGEARRFAAHKVEWNSSLLRRSLPRTVELARYLMDLAHHGQDPAQIATACRALGYSLFISGELEEAAEILARGVALADEIPDAEFAIYGEHPSIVCRAYESQVRSLMGFPETGGRLAEAAVGHARNRKHPHSLAWAHVVAAHTYQEQHAPAFVIRHATEAIELSREHRLAQWLAGAEGFKGWAMCRLDDPAGLGMQEKGMWGWLATGAVLHTTLWRTALAENYILNSEPAAARAHLAAAHAHCESHAENYFRTEIYRVKALCSRAEGAPAAVVEQHLAKAVSIAREQRARLLELRSATILAQLWAEHGQRQKASDLLAPIYDRLTEGFGTCDLRQAQILLDQLRN
jgi:hypothetical protein